MDTVSRRTNAMPGSVKLGRTTMHSPVPQTLHQDIQKASSILERFIKGKNKVDQALIPPSIIAKARGIAVITFLKAGFVWSGRLGSGIVVARLPDGRWSAPSAIGAGGAGFGAQIGASLTDCVFILNTESAVKAFAHGGNLTFGGNLSVCAGPQGRALEGAGALRNLAPIYSYSKSKGLFAGLSLEGSMIVTRDDTNADLYGHKVSPKDLLSGRIEPPVQAECLYRILNFRFANLGTAGKYGSTSAPTMSHSYSTDSATAYNSVAPAHSFTNNSGSGTGRWGVASDNKADYAAAPVSSLDTQALPSYGSSSYGTQSFGAAASNSHTVTAQFDFTGERATDLSFRKGDIITVTKSGQPSEWWRGSVRGGPEGDFPGNYVA